MKVEVAQKSGFCFGVKRAVDMALKVKGKSNTIGPLIHNPQVIAELKKMGVTSKDGIADVDSSTVIIRAHGASKGVIEELTKRGINVIDLTCPFVKKVQDYAIELEKQGYFIVVIGEENHPEVEAIVSHLNNVAVIDKVGKISNIGQHEKIGVVVQTTQTIKLFEEVVAALEKRFNDVKICNTICNATQERQQEAIEIAKRSDIMVVVGGKNSANTRRLTELCSWIVATHHVETVDELKRDWFIGKNKAGIVAGASTSQDMIDKVAERIKNEF
jgi:(E)-4-hydroxy-3-methyl-but-2-enyl pyrophosphate reductase